MIQKTEKREKTSKTKRGLFESVISTIDKHLARLIEKKKRDTNNQYQQWKRWSHYRFYSYLKDNRVDIINSSVSVNSAAWFPERRKLQKFLRNETDCSNRLYQLKCNCSLRISHQENSRFRWLPWWIVPHILERNNTNSA